MNKNKSELVFTNYYDVEFHQGDRVRWIKTDYRGYETGDVVEGVLSYDDYSFKYVIKTDDLRIVSGFNKGCKFELIKSNYNELIYKNFVKRDYVIGARTEQQLNALEQLFIQFQSLGNLGCSREISVYLDGDGQVQLQFLVDGKKLKESNDIGFGKADFINNNFDLG